MLTSNGTLAHAAMSRAEKTNFDFCPHTAQSALPGKRERNLEYME
jgi:hypothetical protein